MKTSAVYIFFISILLINFHDVKAQVAENKKMSKDTVVNANFRINTEVFVLNTCDPTEVSLRKRYDDDSLVFSPQKKVRNLVVHSNRLNAFVIEGINPIRYRYYINNEAVSQFMDDTYTQAQLREIIKYGRLTPYEIVAPRVFKDSILRNNKKQEMDSILAEISRIKDSLREINLQYDSKLQSILSDTQKDANYYKRINDITQPIYSQIRKYEMLLDDKISKFEILTLSLPISSHDVPFFKTILGNQESDTLFRIFPVKYTISDNMRDNIKSYKLLNDNIGKIDKLLNELESAEVKKNDKGIKDLEVLLTENGFKTPLKYFFSKEISFRNKDVIEGVNWRLIRLNIKEFFIGKRYQMIGDFVLATTTDIGTLLQSTLRSLSQTNNHLKLMNCLDESEIKNLIAIRFELGKLFDFIQKTSSELEIIVGYLDIDVKLYSQLAKGINSNYFQLLKYLEELDFLVENNTKEFTLPTSINMRNVDFIRYRVDRDDKVTGSSQTNIYDFWIKGGVKIDFSFGIFASGLVDEVYQKYSITPDTLMVKRQSSGRERYNFSFGGMVNIKPRLGASWVSPGLSFGIIYSENQRLQFLSSLSLHLGKTERILLHAGAAIGFAKSIDLSQNKWESTDYRKGEFIIKAGSNFNIPTMDKFSVRPVFGLTYNLSKKNALMAVSNKGLEKYRELEKGDSKTLAQ
jgi:hypothetical protein